MLGSIFLYLFLPVVVCLLDQYVLHVTMRALLYQSGPLLVIAKHHNCTIQYTLASDNVTLE